MTPSADRTDGDAAAVREKLVVETISDPRGVPDQPDRKADGARAAREGPETAQEEISRLRAQLAEYQSLAGTGRSGSSRHATGWWRPWVAGVLIAVGALLAPVSIVAAWAHDQISDTERYVESVTPLATDPALQNAVIDRITAEIFARLDVKAVTAEAVAALAERGLPQGVADSLQALSTPLADGVRSFVVERVTRLVKSETFAQAWVAANREAHTQLVAVLTGEGTDTIDVSGTTVSVNLAAVIDTVKKRLADSGFALADRIPEVNAQFTIFESADLAKAQNGFSVLKSLARALPVLALLLMAAAVYLSSVRRRTIQVAGLSVAGSMVLLGAALNAFRPVYLNAIPADQLPHDAAASIYDTLVYFIRLNLRAVLLVALAVALGAWLSGPDGPAVAARRGMASMMNAVRGGGERVGVSTGPVGVFAHAYRTLLRSLIIGTALVVYVQAAHPTGAWTLQVLGITVAALLLHELIARPPKSEAQDAAAGHAVVPPLATKPS